MSVRPSAGWRAACGALLCSLVVLLGACSDNASGGTTTTAKPSTTVETTTTAEPSTTVGRSHVAPAPGTIFVANGGVRAGGTGNGSITAYRPSATGNARPIIVITAGMNGPGSVAFDSSGNLWVANSDSIVEYSKAALSRVSPTPTVTISSSVLHSDVFGLAFDPSGDLWVALGGSAAIEFTKAQLVKSGSLAPRVTIYNSDVCSLVFDRAGDLWEGSGDHVLEFTKSQLAKSGSPAPRVIISSSSLDGPCRPTFDSSGDLWVADSGGSGAVEFTKAQLAKSGSRAPRVTISSEVLSSPGDVALSSGDLWVPNSGTGAVLEFTKAQLAKSGSPAPARNIAGPATGLNWPWAVTVEP